MATETLNRLASLQTGSKRFSIAVKKDASVDDYVAYLKLRRAAFTRRKQWLKKVSLLAPLTPDEKYLMLAGRAASRLHPARATGGFWPLDKFPPPPVLLLPARAKSLQEKKPRSPEVAVRNAARATEERMQKAGMVPRQARPKVAPAADAPSKKEAQPATSTAKAHTATLARSEPSAREEKGKSASKRIKEVADKLGDVYRQRDCQRNVAMQLHEALQSAVASERLYGAKTINVDGHHELFRKDNGVYLRLPRGDDPVGVPAGTLKGGKVVALTEGLVSCVNQFVKKAYPDLPLHPSEFYDGAPKAGEALVTVKQMKLKLHQEALLRHGMTQTQLTKRIAAHLKEVNKDEMGLADYEALINELAQAETEPISI